LCAAHVAYLTTDSYPNLCFRQIVNTMLSTSSVCSYTTGSFGHPTALLSFGLCPTDDWPTISLNSEHHSGKLSRRTAWPNFQQPHEFLHANTTAGQHLLSSHFFTDTYVMYHFICYIFLFHFHTDDLQL
jgi:hypothetical protein